MITLGWKEIRENFHWAVLLFISMTMMQFYVLHQIASPNNYQNRGFTVDSDAFLNITTLGYAAMGIVLALVQILPERRSRDRWALVLHRPITRTVNLRWKIIPGLLLYFGAAVPPFLLSIWYVTRPGNYAVPFDLGLVLPPTIDLCVGSVYYLAAMTMALSSGNIWLRVLPALAAIYLGVHVFYCDFFRDTLSRYVLMFIALWAAAWGLIISPTRFRARPWLARVGVLAVAYFGVHGAGEIFTRFWDTLTPSNRPPYTEDYVVDNGQLVHLHYAATGTLLSVTDANDQPLTSSDITIENIWQRRLWYGWISHYIGQPHGYHWTPGKWTYRNQDIYFHVASSIYGAHRETWYWIDKTQSYIGYSQVTNRPIAQIDATGLIAPESTPQPFPASTNRFFLNGNTLVTWQASGAIRAIDLNDHTQVDHQLPDAPIYGLAGFDNEDVIKYASTSDHAITVYNATFAPIATIPYDPAFDLDRLGHIEISPTKENDNYVIDYFASEWIDKSVRDNAVSYVETVDSKGTILQKIVRNPIHNPPWPRSWKDYFSHRLESPAFYYGTIAYKLIGQALGDKSLAGALRYQFVHDRLQTRRFLLRSAATSLFFALLTLYWTRRNHFTWNRAWAWAVFVLWFNLAGFLAFALVVDWPRQIRCPSCSHRRPIEDETCPHCRAAWPKVARDGTEILEEPSTPTWLAL